MSQVTFSDWDGLDRYGLHDLDIRSSNRHGVTMKVRTVLGDVWVPMKAEDFASAASIAAKYVETQAAAVREHEARETDFAINRLRHRGYTVIPPQESHAH